MLSRMMFLVQHLKPGTPIHQLLGMGLRPLTIPAGLVQPLVALSSHPQEALPTHLPLLAFPRLGHLPLAQEPQPSILEPLPSTLEPRPNTLEPRPSTLEPHPSTLEPRPSTLGPRPSTLEPQLPQLDTLQVRVYLDSSPQTLGLLDSFLPTLELQDSFLPCQVSSHQVGRPCNTRFLDSFPPHLERHRASIQMCLTHQVLRGIACTVQVLLVAFPQMEAQDMQEECFPQSPKGPGVQPQGASHPSLARREATVQGPWDNTVVPQLQVESCHHIDRHIFDHNEQLSKSRDEDSTAAITKTPVNIQSERRVLENESMGVVWNEGMAVYEPVPYDLQLHAGIMPQLVITIVGEPIPGGDRFNVDFMRGGEVVFHFNARFHEHTIVRNSQLGGCWGPEERDGGFPFVQGRPFELKILVETDGFKVAVDGGHLLEYEHRTGGFEDVTRLHIGGDIALFSAAPSMI